MPVNGLDELSKKLKELAQNAEALNGQHSVTFWEALTPSFISKHSRFENISDFFEASGFKIDSAEAFKAIPEEQLDSFVQSETEFSTWHEMLGAATRLWIKNKPGL